MCIYCGTNYYHKIYKNHYGLIPKDETGRTYDIHHIDGDHSNNDPENLKALSIQEHYDVHYAQGDWGACVRLSGRMQMSPEEISRLASLEQKRRVSNGTHNMLGGSVQKKRVENRTHNFLGEAHNKRQLKNGNHVTQKKDSMEKISRMASIREKEKVSNGDHFWQTEKHKTQVSERNLRLVREGKHPSQQKVTCPHCNKIGPNPQMIRHHFDRCAKR